LFSGASHDFKKEMSGPYLNEKAVEVKPSAAALDVGERERLERWTEEKMKAGGWICGTEEIYNLESVFRGF
jgi:hypothetical protein